MEKCNRIFTKESAPATPGRIDNSQLLIHAGRLVIHAVCPVIDIMVEHKLTVKFSALALFVGVMRLDHFAVSNYSDNDNDCNNSDHSDTHPEDQVPRYPRNVIGIGDKIGTVQRIGGQIADGVIHVAVGENAVQFIHQMEIVEKCSLGEKTRGNLVVIKVHLITAIGNIQDHYVGGLRFVDKELLQNGYIFA